MLELIGLDEADGSESNIPATSSNVRKDLTEWQERHATLVLTTVKVNSLFLILFILIPLLNFVVVVFVLLFLAWN